MLTKLVNKRWGGRSKTYRSLLKLILALGVIFKLFYYLFSYNLTNTEFSIPHDLKILKEVFKVNNGEYNKENSYWKSNSIKMLIEELSTLKKEKFMNQLEEIKKSYIILSNKYQASKNNNLIPLK